ncbi:MAG: LamG domain-containing protein [Planctomycetota bacterium]
MTCSRRGGVLVLVLIVSVVVAVLGVGGLLMRGRTLDVAQIRADGSQARLLARSAAELGLEAIEDGADLSSMSSGTQFVNERLDTATLRASLASAASSGSATVRGEGLIGDARALLDVDVTFQTTYRERAMALGPVGYWTMDQASGITEADLINGTILTYGDFGADVGAVTGPDGGPAPMLDNAWGAAGSLHPGWMAEDDSTMALWVWRPSAVVDDGWIVSKDEPGVEAGRLSLWVNGNRIMATLKDGSGAVTLNGPTLVRDTWTHVAVSMGGDGFTLYVNGVAQASDPAWTIGIRGTDANPNRTALAIGASYAQSSLFPSHPLMGSVRDFGFYDKQLNAVEIAELYGTGWTTPISPPRVVAGSWRWAVD